ncbi:MAG: hypothetical protein U0Q21_02665 [Dermatophilaceae bacterium]
MVLTKLRAYTAAILAGTAVGGAAVGVHLAAGRSADAAVATASTAAATLPSDRLGVRQGRSLPTPPGVDDLLSGDSAAARQDGQDRQSTQDDQNTQSGTSAQGGTSPQTSQGSTSNQGSSTSQGGFQQVPPLGMGGPGGTPGGNTGGS